MEKRAILAAMLMAGLLIAYQALFTPPAPEAPPPAKTTTQAPAPPAPAPAAGVPAVPPPTASPAATVPERTATIDTPLYRAVVSSAGGAFREWLLHYRGDKPLVIP